jgi:hypothetical protein
MLAFDIKRPALGGALLTWGIASKIFPGVLVLYLLFEKRWLEVDVKRTPGSRMTHEIYAEDDLIGTWSTGTKAINAIPFVCAAKPGLVSPLDRMLRLHD